MQIKLIYFQNWKTLNPKQRIKFYFTENAFYFNVTASLLYTQDVVAAFVLINLDIEPSLVQFLCEMEKTVKNIISKNI